MQQLKFILRKTGRFLAVSFELFVALIYLYLLSYVILSRIPSDAEIDSSEKTQEVYISTNGVHTDFIVPIHSELFDWEKELDMHQALQIDTFQTHFAIGWGDKNFFLKTKNWSDLTAGTAFKAMFGLGEGAMHLVLCCPKDLDQTTIRKITLSKKQYLDLTNYIKDSFEGNFGSHQRILQHPYGDYHFYFDSKYTYSMVYTCNSWTNDGLKAAGQKACFWTPFKDGFWNLYDKN
ncbi:MAG: TIGR02117 family protein [Fluviicola sp.]|nr:TIGR02117 family protein [Fluviicola sp.]